MIGLEDLARFANTTMEIAGGDVRAQLDAWGVDYDGFFAYCTTYANEMAARFGSDPRAFVIAFFCGFELGFRSCAEGGASFEVPDSLPEDFDRTDRRHD